MKKLTWATIAALSLCTLLGATPAAAQISRLGGSFVLWNAATRGSDVAYDTRNGVYFAVSAHGAVIGRFVSPDGAVLGDPFVIQSVVRFGQFPHVAYSPDANGGNGAFLVTWLESDGGGNAPTSLHTRLVSYTAGLISPDRQTFGNDTYWEIMGAPVAYSTVSREFLVLWRQYFDTNIFGLRLNNAGDVISGVIPVANTALFESDPSLTYNPAQDEFFAVYHRGLGTVSVLGQRIKAGTGALVGGPSTLAQAADVRTTGVTYNPTTGQYLAAWHQLPADAVFGRLVGADGGPLGNVTVLSTRYGTYDALSVDTNATTGTALVAGHDKLTVESGGVEVNASGTPTSAGLPITAGGGNGNFYPRVAANNTRPEWLVVASNQFSRLIGQRVQTSAPTGGGGAAVSRPLMSLDIPSTNSTVSLSFAVAGWAADTGSPWGTGVDAVHVWAFPTNGGSPVFVGTATMGISRPDVGAYLGGRFANSGYTLSGSLAPGVYDLNVYAFSTVTGNFNNSATKRITVTGPVSQPHMYVDSPVQNQTVSQNISVVGWAIDQASTFNGGVEAVHVYAYPLSGAAPVFVGAAGVGFNRSDVGAYFGAARFASSGFAVQGTLPPGEYNLVVFAFSSITRTFNQAMSVRIRVV